MSDMGMANVAGHFGEGHLGGHECPTCGGPLMPMGALGSRMHFRCRNCGMDSSSKSSEHHDEVMRGHSEPDDDGR